MLTARLDNRGLFKVAPFNLLPLLSGAALEYAGLRASGLLARFDPVALWSAESGWHLSWNDLVARYLGPEMFAAGLLAAVRSTDRVAAAASAAAALGLLATGVMAGFAWRSLAAWRGPVLFVLMTLAWAATLHFLLFLTFWILHWLNFWLLFILLLFVELRRHEGNGSKYQAS
jgi:hypothetical protein